MFVVISDKIASLRFVYVGSVYWKFGGAIMVIFVPFLLKNSIYNDEDFLIALW